MYLDRIDKAIRICDTECRTPAFRNCEATANGDVAEGVRAGQLYELGNPVKIPERENPYALIRQQVCRCGNRYRGKVGEKQCRWCRENRKTGGALSDADSSDGRGHCGRAA